MADIAGFYGARFSATPPGVDESVWHCQGCNCGGEIGSEWAVRLGSGRIVGPYETEKTARSELEYWQAWAGARLVKRRTASGPWEEEDTDAA
jgi:hypothetical protein